MIQKPKMGGGGKGWSQNCIEPINNQKLSKSLWPLLLVSVMIFGRKYLKCRFGSLVLIVLISCKGNLRYHTAAEIVKESFKQKHIFDLLLWSCARSSVPSLPSTPSPLPSTPSPLHLSQVSIYHYCLLVHWAQFVSSIVADSVYYHISYKV